jgi:hypothetical protein
MYEIIQALPNNPSFVLILIAIAGYIWLNPPKLKNTWEKHIVGNFDNSGHHPRCFDCNNNGSACYNDIRRCAALRDQLGCSLKDFEV